MRMLAEEPMFNSSNALPSAIFDDALTNHCGEVDLDLSTYLDPHESMTLAYHVFFAVTAALLVAHASEVEVAQKYASTFVKKACTGPSPDGTARIYPADTYLRPRL